MPDTTQQQPSPEALSAEQRKAMHERLYNVLRPCTLNLADAKRLLAAHEAQATASAARDQEIERLRAALADVEATRKIVTTEEMLACSAAIRVRYELDPCLEDDEETEFALRQMWMADRDWQREQGQHDLASARAEAQALRERVRTDAIRHYPESGWEACRLCDGEWKRGQPEKHEEGCSAALAAPSAADGPQAICVQCFVVFPISHGEAEWIKEDGVRLLCPECCHDATGIDQWNDGDPSADGAGSGEG